MEEINFSHGSLTSILSFCHRVSIRNYTGAGSIIFKSSSSSLYSYYFSKLFIWSHQLAVPQGLWWWHSMTLLQTHLHQQNVHPTTVLHATAWSIYHHIHHWDLQVWPQHMGTSRNFNGLLHSYNECPYETERPNHTCWPLRHLHLHNFSTSCPYPTSNVGPNHQLRGRDSGMLTQRNNSNGSSSLYLWSANHFLWYNKLVSLSTNQYDVSLWKSIYRTIVLIGFPQFIKSLLLQQRVSSASSSRHSYLFGSISKLFWRHPTDS